METKPKIASKTLWVNGVALLASVASVAFGFEVDAEAQAAIVGGIMAVVNIGLRLVTVKGLS